MLKEKSGYLLSVDPEDREHKLFYTLFHPEDESQIKATLLILHGMQEHSGRYEAFARFLANNGFAVVTFDHLGHGKTAASSDQLGYFYAKNPQHQVVMDAENMANYLENKFPYVPHFVLGHSMGSFITRCLLQEAQQRFDGAIIVGTGGRIPGTMIGRRVFSFLNVLMPEKRFAFVNRTFSKSSNKRFSKEPNQHNTNWLSLDKKNRLAFLSDPLCGVPFTNNGFYTLLCVVDDATKRTWASKLMKKLPFYFVSGADDPIGNFGKGVEKTVDQLKSDGFSNVHLDLYPKMRHEILNEVNKEEVWNNILKWMKSQLPA